MDIETQQIIEILHDDDERPIVAASISILLEDIIAGLESGRLNYDLELGLIDLVTEEKCREGSEKCAKTDWQKFWLSFLCFDLNGLPRAFGSPGFMISWVVETLAIIVYVGIFTIGIIVCHKLRTFFL